MKRAEKIDIGTHGAWRVEGLKQLDDEVSQLAHHHAATEHGAQTVRWFLLDTVVGRPVTADSESFEEALEQAESSLLALVSKKSRTRKGHLDDTEVGTVLGFATDYPVRNREWRKHRERVFERIGLEFGPAPDPVLARSASFDIGSAGAWRYDVIRALDVGIVQLARHHAETAIGAQTIRWYIWHELTGVPRPVELLEIEKQLENAEASVLATVSDDVRRRPGHLGDDEVAKMVGFRASRPVKEGYYRQLREDVFKRVALGFGAVELPEISPREGTVPVGRQGAWKVDNIARLDGEILDMARRFARTEHGAQALRWHLWDRITEDPEPVDPMLVEQRLRKLGASVLDLFGFLRKRGRSFLSDNRIARFVGLGEGHDLQRGAWTTIRERVKERVDHDVFHDDEG